MLRNEFAAAVARNIHPDATQWIEKIAIQHSIDRNTAEDLAYLAAEKLYMSSWFDHVLDQYEPGKLAKLSGGGCAGRHYVLVREILTSETAQKDFGRLFCDFLAVHFEDLARRYAGRANQYRRDFTRLIVSVG